MAVEAYVMGLFHLYPTLYLHKATRGAEKLYTELLVRIITLVRDGSVKRTGLSDTHPIVLFAKKPDSDESVLPLDDSLIWASLHQLADASDPLIQDFSKRIRDRKLYKCIDVREEVVQKFSVDQTAKVDKVCAEIALKIRRWRSNDDGGIPRILTDEPERVLYKHGPVNRIWVQLGRDGPPVDIAKLSAAVRATRPFKGFRVYYRDGDSAAEKKIRTIIPGEKGHGRRH